jgi:hypothetical protein
MEATMPYTVIPNEPVEDPVPPKDEDLKKNLDKDPPESEKKK